MLGTLFTMLFLLSLYFSVLSGNEAQAGNALLTGAQDAIPFCLGIAGSLCFWSAWMELAERCGLAARLSRLLRPLLCRLFPRTAHSDDVLAALTLGGDDYIKKPYSMSVLLAKVKVHLKRLESLKNRPL